MTKDARNTNGQIEWRKRISDKHEFGIVKGEKDCGDDELCSCIIVFYDDELNDLIECMRYFYLYGFKFKRWHTKLVSECDAKGTGTGTNIEINSIEVFLSFYKYDNSCHCRSSFVVCVHTHTVVVVCYYVCAVPGWCFFVVVSSSSLV